MNTVKVNLQQKLGVIKPMNCVNNGPTGSAVRKTGNVASYEALHIPYARLHDTAFIDEYYVDVHRVFPNFDADVDDPASYIFEPTDAYLERIESVGTKTFYRLGAAIEHGRKKGTYPPKDYLKWAQICEHIIMHYTQGWANGYKMDIEYWEVWNEPDCKNHDGSNPCWQGTFEEFYDFFEVAVKYLKGKFPSLKIGGPATCNLWQREFGENIVKQIAERKIPIDFYSIHWYGHRICDYQETIDLAVKDLADNNITGVELILNEWNYNKGWLGDLYMYSMATIKNMKGAAFTAGIMTVSQKSPLDMLMYYEGRICGFCGLWAQSDYSPLKTYYTFKAFDELKQLGTEVSATDNDDLYTLASTNGDESAIMLTRFNTEDVEDVKKVTVSVEGNDKPIKADFYLLDDKNDLTLVKSEYFTAEKFDIYLNVPNNTIYLIKMAKA